MQTLNNCPSWVTPKDLTYISNKRDFLGLWTQSHDLESNISLGFMAVVKICCLMADVPNPRTPKSILFFPLHFFNSCPNAHLPTQLHEIKFTFWRYSTDKLYFTLYILPSWRTGQHWLMCRFFLLLLIDWSLHIRHYKDGACIQSVYGVYSVHVAKNKALQYNSLQQIIPSLSL